MLLALKAWRSRRLNTSITFISYTKQHKFLKITKNHNIVHLNHQNHKNDQKKTMKTQNNRLIWVLKLQWCQIAQKKFIRIH